MSWSSKAQPTIALSLTEAEYMLSIQAAKEAVWLQHIPGELNYPQTEATPLFEDN